MNENDMTPEQLLAEATRLAGLAAERSTQLTRDDLAAMTPQQIEQARIDGRFDNILKGNN